MLNLKKRDWFFLLAGTALMAIGAEGFFEHADLVAGGITGIGIMLDEWTTTKFDVHIPLWFVNLAGNLPLFLIAWKLKGRSFVSRSILTAVLFSLMLYVEEIFPLCFPVRFFNNSVHSSKLTTNLRLILFSFRKFV